MKRAPGLDAGEHGARLKRRRPNSPLDEMPRYVAPALRLPLLWGGAAFVFVLDQDQDSDQDHDRDESTVEIFSFVAGLLGVGAKPALFLFAGFVTTREGEIG